MGSEQQQYRVIVRELFGGREYEEGRIDCLAPQPLEEAAGSPCATLEEANELADEALRSYEHDDRPRCWFTHGFSSKTLLDADGCKTIYRWWAPHSSTGIRIKDISELVHISVERECIATGKKLQPRANVTRYHVHHSGLGWSKFVASVPTLAEANQLMEDAVLERSGCQYEKLESRTADGHWFEAQHTEPPPRRRRGRAVGRAVTPCGARVAWCLVRCCESGR